MKHDAPGVGFEPPVVPVLGPVNTGCSPAFLDSSEESLLHKRTTRDIDDHSYTNALGARAGRSCQSQKLNLIGKREQEASVTVF
jgi:hypothetical protein